MKKFIGICLCGLLTAAVVTGCGNRGGDQAAPASASEEKVQLGEYKGVTYTPVKAEVTDEEVETEIQAMLDAYPTINEVDRAAEEGDVVNIDYVGMKDGEPFDGGTAEGYNLELGSGSFIEGFEDGLIGAVKGQELSLNLTFPDTYFNEDLAGQDVVFDVTVNAVQESIPAELNDEFVKSYTEYDTVDAYRAGVRDDLEKAAATAAENQKQAEVFLKVVDGATVNLTQEEIQATYDEQYAMYEEQATAYGMDMEKMVSLYGMELEAFQSQLMVQAEEAAKQEAVVNAIADAEKITVSDEDRQALAEEFGFESVDAMNEQTGEDTANEYILSRKVIDFLVENAVEGPEETEAGSAAETTTAG